MLFRVGDKKPEYDSLRTLVLLLNEEIAPVGKRIVGRWSTVAGVRIALGERFGGQFGNNEALRGILRMGVIHQVSSFSRSYD